MIRTRLARVAVAVAAAALAVPAFAPAAHAAPHPKVPTVDAMAKVYPHLAGGQVYGSDIDKVYGPAKKCNKTKRIKGATARSGSYVAASATSPTAAAPGVFVVAYRLPSAAKAKALLTAVTKQAKACPAGGVVIPGIKSTKVTKFKVKIGDSSAGFTVRAKTDDGTYISNMIMARQGKHIVSTSVSTMDGEVPSKKKSVAAAKLATRTAG